MREYRGDVLYSQRGISITLQNNNNKQEAVLVKVQFRLCKVGGDKTGLLLFGWQEQQTAS